MEETGQLQRRSLSKSTLMKQLSRWLNFSVAPHTIVVPGLEENRSKVDSHITEKAIQIHEQRMSQGWMDEVSPGVEIYKRRKDLKI